MGSYVPSGTPYVAPHPRPFVQFASSSFTGRRTGRGHLGTE